MTRTTRMTRTTQMTQTTRMTQMTRKRSALHSVERPAASQTGA